MKSTSFLIVALLLISSISIVSIGKNASISQEEKVVTLVISQSFDVPKVINTNKFESYVEIESDDSNKVFYQEGYPLLPCYSEKIVLPFASKILDVKIKTKNIDRIDLTEKILPAPNKVIQGMPNTEITYAPSEKIYHSDELYPIDWYSYNIGAGLDKNLEHKNFLNIELYPIRYNPVKNIIDFTDNIELEIRYEIPKNDFFKTDEEYDMVIISPEIFSEQFNDFIAHKNKYNIDTYLKTIEEIYSDYSGFDEAEKIKLYIKDAIETYNIKYVLLIGGMTSTISGDSRDNENIGLANWYLPVRYTNLVEIDDLYDPGFISDLYYADIYDSQGGFSSWDSDKNQNSDGLYATWINRIGYPKDIIDLYPDVNLGRLAVRSSGELQTVLNKIMNYEKYKHKTNWYDNMLLIGGDSHEDNDTNYLEGELACDYMHSQYMSEFTPTKLYSSNRYDNPSKTPSTENIVREISEGYGHLLFEGHGSPGSWNTHWPGEFNWDDTPGGIKITHFPNLNNEEKLPITVIGGCHNSMFNVTLMATTLDEPFMWTYGFPVPECFAWHLVKKNNGGSIASLGNTGLGYGAVGNHGDIDGDGIDQPDTLERLGGYQIRMFYEEIDDGEDILGKVWAQTINKYLDTFPGMDYQADAKTAEQWPLLGDPSLKIGGYRTEDSSKSINIDNNFLESHPLILKILEIIKDRPIFKILFYKI